MKKSKVSNLIICAVHITTESSDHYNMCLRSSSVEGIVDQIKKNLGDEIAWISESWIDVLTGPKDSKNLIKNALSFAQIEATETEEV